MSNIYRFAVAKVHTFFDLLKSAEGRRLCRAEARGHGVTTVIAVPDVLIDASDIHGLRPRLTNCMTSGQT